MTDERNEILEQVAARHHTTAAEVRSAIAEALRLSDADPALCPEDAVFLAAIAVLLSRPLAVC